MTTTAAGLKGASTVLELIPLAPTRVQSKALQGPEKGAKREKGADFASKLREAGKDGRAERKGDVEKVDEQKLHEADGKNRAAEGETAVVEKSEHPEGETVETELNVTESPVNSEQSKSEYGETAAERSPAETADAQVTQMSDEHKQLQPSESATQDAAAQVVQASALDQTAKNTTEAPVVRVDSKLAELSQKPLTVESLTDLLLTIDPSLAKQILRPSSLNGAGQLAGLKGKVLGAEELRGVPSMVDAWRGVEGATTGFGEVTPAFASGALDRATFPEVTTPSTGLVKGVDTAATVAGSDGRATVARRGATEITAVPTPAARDIAAVQGALVGKPLTVPTADQSGTSEVAAPTGVGGVASAAGAHGAGGAGAKQGDTLGLATGRGGASQAARVASDAELEAQVSRGLASALSQRGGTVLVRLNPEALGQLRVQIDMKDQLLRVRVEAGSDEVKESIDQSSDDLKRSLESRGYTVERINVQVDKTLTGPEQPKGADGQPRFDQGLADGQPGGGFGQSAGGGAWSGRGDASTSPPASTPSARGADVTADFAGSVGQGGEVINHRVAVTA